MRGKERKSESVSWGIGQQRNAALGYRNECQLGLGVMISHVENTRRDVQVMLVRQGSGLWEGCAKQ